MSLYDDAALFDALLPIGPDCLAHYTALARATTGNVLELACGSGLLLLPLAATGRHVTGVDNAPAMLDAARTRAEAAGVAIDLQVGDMRSFMLQRQFTLIIIARNSLLHFHTTEDLLTTLACARAHLAPGGVLAFDVFHPSLEALARPPGTRNRVMQVEHDTLGTISVEQESDYDAVSQVQRATWFISSSSGRREKVPLHLRSIFPQELPLLLRAAGLELVARFGEFKRTPFASASPRQVCIARPM